MMLEQLTLKAPEVEAGAEPTGPIIPVLIRVPSLDPTTGARRRPPIRRRRLRREVRMAGSLLIMATPLAWALMMMGGRDPEPLAGVPARLIGIEGLGTSVDESARNPAIARPSTSLGPETAATVGPASPRATWGPVVLPGYLLPMDGNEEPAHAGG